jgi:hypothetical protein
VSRCPFLLWLTVRSIFWGFDVIFIFSGVAGPWRAAGRARPGRGKLCKTHPNSLWITPCPGSRILFMQKRLTRAPNAVFGRHHGAWQKTRNKGDMQISSCSSLESTAWPSNGTSASTQNPALAKCCLGENSKSARVSTVYRQRRTGGNICRPEAFVIGLCVSLGPALAAAIYNRVYSWRVIERGNRRRRPVLDDGHPGERALGNCLFLFLIVSKACQLSGESGRSSAQRFYPVRRHACGK